FLSPEQHALRRLLLVSEVFPGEGRLQRDASVAAFGPEVVKRNIAGRPCRMIDGTVHGAEDGGRQAERPRMCFAMREEGDADAAASPIVKEHRLAEIADLADVPAGRLEGR